MEIVVSLLLTIIEFGLFPIIWAYTRSDTITAKKYRWICFGVNLAINLVLHVLITSSAAGFYSAAYMLWTFVFSAIGVKILNNRNLLQDQDAELENNPSVEKTEIVEPTQTKAYPQKTSLPVEQAQDNLIHERKVELSTPNRSTLFCRKCGARIPADSVFCQKCGEKVVRME